MQFSSDPLTDRDVVHPALPAMPNGEAALEKQLGSFSPSETVLPRDTAFLLLGVYPNEMKTYVCKELAMSNFIPKPRTNPNQLGSG